MQKPEETKQLEVKSIKDNKKELNPTLAYASLCSFNHGLDVFKLNFIPIIDKFQTVRSEEDKQLLSYYSTYEFIEIINKYNNKFIELVKEMNKEYQEYFTKKGAFEDVKKTKKTKQKPKHDNKD